MRRGGKRSRRVVWAILVALLLFAGTAFLLLPIHGEGEIYDTVIRLHVVANSDSEEDQGIKMRVRDAVLSVTVPLTEGCATRDEAEEAIRSHIGEIQTVARETLRELGSDDGVTVTFTEEDYPKRDYDSFCFPAGRYLSLRVRIGDAEGQNFWCCLFPALCRSVAVTKREAADACVEVGLTPTQYRVITESDRPIYRVRFRVLELIQGWFR